MTSLLSLKDIEINGKIYSAQLAVISDTMLGIEDHGIMTSFLYLDYMDGGTQGAGGYALDGYDSINKNRIGVSSSILFIRRTLEVVGVDTWEKLKGKRVIALTNPLVRGLVSADDGTTYMIFEDTLT